MNKPTWLIAAALLVAGSSLAVAQSNPSTASDQSGASSGGQSVRQNSPLTTGSNAPSSNPDAEAGTRNGTAHPNMTGSSGSSGTTGVDSSTSDSH